jgi:hypothetical protein
VKSENGHSHRIILVYMYIDASSDCFYFSSAGYKNKPQDGAANCAFTLELGMVANSTEMCEMNFRIPCLPCNIPIRGK